MAYSSWSVVFGEQPSAAKWNILGTNDASFHDGTGIDTNAIAAASLSTSAIKLGYSLTSSSDQTGISSDTMVNLTSGTSITITIPSGGRDVFIQGHVHTLKGGGSGATVLTLRNGSTTGGTQIGINNSNVSSGNRFVIFCQAYLVAPAAGSYVIGMSLSSAGASSDISNSAIARGILTAWAI